MRLILIAFIFSSCSSQNKKLNSLEKEAWYFLEDVSGQYDVKQSVYTEGKKIYFEKILYDSKNKKEYLEKYNSVLKYGIDSKKEAYLVPIVSQYKTWIDQKNLFSEIKIRPKMKKYQVKSSNENTAKFVPFVESNFVCPFSFIPDCLKINGFLKEAISGKEFRSDMWVMWDNYPFNEKIYARIFPGLYFKSKILFEGVKEELYHFTFEVSGQSVTVLYNKKLEFEKMFWVAQGLSFILK